MMNCQRKLLNSRQKTNNRMKGTYIFLADGYEPLEALAPMDILRRANVKCKFVSMDGSPVVNSTHGFGIQATISWDEFVSESEKDGIDCIICPGGLPGAENLGTDERLAAVIRKHFAQGGLTCAICAAPELVLARTLGTALSGRRMTGYEGFDKGITAAGGIYTGANVEVDGNLITAKGPGLAIDFGLAIMKKMVDPRIYEVAKHAMML